MTREELEKARDAIHAAETQILRYYGITKFHRYAGSFPDTRTPGAPTFAEHYGLRDEKARDDIAQRMQKLIEAYDLQDEVRVTTDNSDTHYPYSLAITIGGKDIKTIDQAYERMVFFMKAVSMPYAEANRGNGMSWAAYKAMFAVADDMTFKRGAEGQVGRFDTYRQLFNADMRVVGNHTSKSIRLPVAQIELPRNLMKITFRDNFHDICVSVDSTFPVKDEGGLKRLFNTNKVEGYFEGFPEALVHGAYADNNKSFSLTVNGHDEFLMLLAELSYQDKRHQPPVRPKAAPGLK